MKKTAINLLKYGTSAAIIAYLVWDVQRMDSFDALWRHEKSWGLLAAAWSLIMAGVMLTIVRWQLLVRALEIPFSLKDAFRLGFLGYLMNFFSLGAVGGDLFKAIFIAREHKSRRPEAVATVVIDRLIGLYGLFLLTTTTVLWTGMLYSPVREIRVVSWGAIAATVVSTIGMILVLTPGFTNGAFSEFLANLPRIGPIVGKLLSAVRMYRRKLPVLFGTTVMSIGLHAVTALGIYCCARGLGGGVPSLSDHFVLVPMGILVGILPLPMNGLGAFEGVMEFFYQAIPSAAAVAKGQGVVVALGFRMITVSIAIVGVFYYLASRREVAALLKETRRAAAEEEARAATTAERAPLVHSGLQPLELGSVDLSAT